MHPSQLQNGAWGQNQLVVCRHEWKTLTPLRKSTPNFNLGTWEAMLRGHLSMSPYICLKYIDYVYCNSIISVKFMSAFCDSNSFNKPMPDTQCVLDVILGQRNLLTHGSSPPGACFLVDTGRRRVLTAVASKYTVGREVGQGGPDAQKCLGP